MAYIDLTKESPTLQFRRLDGSYNFMTFEIAIDDDPAHPDALGFEICNAPAGKLPKWRCTLMHRDGSSVRLEIGRSECAAPIMDPPPDTWLFPGDPDPCFHLYFELYDAKSWILALNATTPPAEAGYPLQLFVHGEPIHGKKIKVLYPVPGA